MKTPSNGWSSRTTVKTHRRQLANWAQEGVSMAASSHRVIACRVWVVVVLVLAGVCAQEGNSVGESFDPPPALYPGDVEIFSDEPCPNGLYEDTDRLASPNTKICVEARLNCKVGVTWQSMCNNCTCREGAKSLPSIECTQEDCFGYQLPEEDLGNSNLCGDVADCPDGCGFVRRTATCIYCQCTSSEPANQEPMPAESEAR